MKLFNSAFVLFGLAAVAAAQSAAPPSQVVATKPAAGSSQKAKAKSPFAPSKTAAAKPASPAMGTAASAQKGTHSTAAARPEVAAAKSATARGRRDPFINPVVKSTATGQQPAACSSGKRCLAIREMVLRGVVKGQNGMIAVVENAARKTYFLRENDPVFNGYVVRITGDSVIFKENTQDSAGHATSHEVVKTLAPQV